MSSASNTQIAVVLVHGFGGHHYEIEPLAQVLSNLGHQVFTPILEGHSPNDAVMKANLKSVGWTDWVDSVRDACQEAFESFERVYYIGFSMGGMIGNILCDEFHFSGLITINTPIYFWDFKRILANIRQDLQSSDWTHLRYYWTSGTKFPLRALLEFQKILARSKRRWRLIQCPHLIIQALDDDAVQPKSAHYIFDHSASAHKKLVWIEGGSHQVLSSTYSDEVCTLIGKWIVEVSPYSNPN